MTRRNISDLKESLQFTRDDIDEKINGFNQKVKEIEIDLNEIKKKHNFKIDGISENREES